MDNAAKASKHLVFLPFPETPKYRTGEFFEYLREQIESERLSDNIILEDGLFCIKSDKGTYKSLLKSMKAEYDAALANGDLD